MLLMIDNYDSFTYNVVQYFQELGQTIEVHRNDAITLLQIAHCKPKGIIISPGPKSPVQAGISCDVIRHFYNKIPILGICLGHQCIGEVFGAKVVHAKQLMHGKTSMITHVQQGLFKGIKNPLEVVRYHSLVLEPASLPDELMVIASTLNNDASPPEIMAIKHRDYPVMGVQFHPESILSEAGHALLGNFLGESV